MIKKHKLAAILSSVVILIPALFGLIVWNQLPELLVTHWGFDGTADATSARAWAVFALPLLLSVRQSLPPRSWPFPSIG